MGQLFEILFIIGNQGKISTVKNFLRGNLNCHFLETEDSIENSNAAKLALRCFSEKTEQKSLRLECSFNKSIQRGRPFSTSPRMTLSSYSLYNSPKHVMHFPFSIVDYLLPRNPMSSRDTWDAINAWRTLQ